MLLDLDIKISRKLVNEVCKYLNSKQSYEFTKFCQYYFKAFKDGILDEVLNMDSSNRTIWFVGQINGFNTNSKPSIYSKIGIFNPTYSSSNNIWGSKLPLYFTPIPMGGQNKK